MQIEYCNIVNCFLVHMIHYFEKVKCICNISCFKYKNSLFYHIKSTRYNSISGKDTFLFFACKNNHYQYMNKWKTYLSYLQTLRIVLTCKLRDVHTSWYCDITLGDFHNSLSRDMEPHTISFIDPWIHGTELL